MSVARRRVPLLPWTSRSRYQSMVTKAFTGPGRGISQILLQNGLLSSPTEVERFLTKHGRQREHLPRDLEVGDWVDLFSRRR